MLVQTLHHNYLYLNTDIYKHVLECIVIDVHVFVQVETNVMLNIFWLTCLLLASILIWPYEANAAKKINIFSYFKIINRYKYCNKIQVGTFIR